VASGGPGLVKTAGYTITVADILGGNKFLYNSASPGTFTLPTSSLVDGMVVNVAQIGAGALTVSGGTIVGTTVTTAQYQGLSFVYVASGTTWYSIAPNATAPGLAIVTPTSIANSGGSASASGGAVTFSAVNSISLNGVFTSAYKNYRVLWDSDPSANVTTAMRLRVSGTDNSSINYWWAQAVGNYAGSGTASGASGQTAWTITSTDAGTSPSWGSMDVMGPQVAENTAFLGLTAYSQAAGSFSGAFFNSTQFDGFTIYPGSGTITGSLRVYGYKTS
jgi:hypothetical protein